MGALKCIHSIVFCTVTKLSKTNLNITIGSEKVDWMRSFRFWPESEHRFVSGPNGGIKCINSIVFCTVTKLTKTNLNITIGSKKVDLVRSFRFWSESVHLLVSVPNRGIKCIHSIVFSTVTKLTKTNLNITIGSKKVDWVRSFRFWTESVHRFVSGPNRAIKCIHSIVFLHSNETDQNEPIHHYWVQKSGLGAFVSFLTQIGASFRFVPNGGIKCINSIVF